MEKAVAVVGTWDSEEGGTAFWAEFLQGPLGGGEVVLGEEQVKVPASKEFPGVPGVGFLRVKEVNAFVGRCGVRELLLSGVDGITPGLPDVTDEVPCQGVR